MIKGVLNKTGVFSVMLLATVFAVFMYSPTNGSFAAGDASDVTVNVGTVLSFALSTDSISMEGMPGQTVISDPIRVTAYTNNIRGLKVEICDADDDNYMRHIEVDDAYISPILGEVLQKILDDDMTIEEYAEWAASQYDITVTRVDNLHDDGWGYVDPILTYVQNDGHEYATMINPINGYTTSSGVNFGGSHDVIWAKKPNSQYTPGLHTDAVGEGGGYSVGEYVNVDDDLNFYGDVKFVVKIGNRITSGKYTDTVLLTAYTQDH